MAGTAMLALALAGCSGASGPFDSFQKDKLFSTPVSSIFTRDEAASVQADKNFNLGPRGPVAPEDLVGPDGSCGPGVAEAPVAVAAAPADGGPAGDVLAPPPVLGGIALGMSECQAVRRAGMPSNISIGVGDNNERKAVLTYIGGNWPGIYTFTSGRLKEISAAPAPAPQRPARPAPRKPAPRRG